MERLRLLLVDENADDAFIIDRALRRAGFDPRCDRVATPEALQTAMSASDDYDVILCDSCGLRLALNVILPAAHAACPRTPILVVSSRHESEFRRAMARDQVAGFVSKEHLEDIPAAIAFLRSAPRENYASGWQSGCRANRRRGMREVHAYTASPSGRTLLAPWAGTVLYCPWEAHAMYRATAPVDLPQTVSFSWLPVDLITRVIETATRLGLPVNVMEGRSREVIVGLPGGGSLHLFVDDDSSS
jgi:hypothetical protein